MYYLVYEVYILWLTFFIVLVLVMIGWHTNVRFMVRGIGSRNKRPLKL